MTAAKRTPQPPAKKAPAKKAPTKARPKKSAPQSVATRLAKLEHDFDTLLWLYVEERAKARLEVARQVLAHPQVQQAMLTGTPEQQQQILAALGELTK